MSLAKSRPARPADSRRGPINHDIYRVAQPSDSGVVLERRRSGRLTSPATPAATPIKHQRWRGRTLLVLGLLLNFDRVVFWSAEQPGG